MVVSPNEDDEALWINQDAWYTLGAFDADKKMTYHLNKPGNGAFVFVIDGAISLVGEQLEKRDAIGLNDVAHFDVSILEDAKLLIIEVPMH